MFSNKKRIISIALYVLMAVSAIFALIFYFGGVVAGTENTTFEEPVITEIFLIWAYILLGLTMIIAILFPLIRMFKNPKKALKTVFGVIGLSILVGIMYLLASDEVIVLTRDVPGNVPFVLRWVGTGLNTLYVMFVAAVLAIIYAETSKAIK